MATETLTAAILALMLNVQPPGRSLITDARETPEAGAARYQEIAGAVADVSDGNLRTAALLLAVSWMESGWRRDVDLGVGPLSRGGGRDSCLMQLRVSNTDHDELVADRRRCFTEGLALIRRSFRACRRNPRELRLAAYGSGSCSRGHAGSRTRVQVADRFYAKLTAHPDS